MNHKTHKKSFLFQYRPFVFGMEFNGTERNLTEFNEIERKILISFKRSLQILFFPIEINDLPDYIQRWDISFPLHLLNLR